MKIDPRIDWRLARLEDRQAALGEWGDDGPGDDDAWLSPGERQTLTALRDPSRREGWLQARVLAKQLILVHERALICDASEIDVVSCDAFGRGVRPRVAIGGRAMPWSLSISHTETAALVALCTVPGLSVGVDLVHAASPSRGFLRMWFDGPERELMAAGDWQEPCRIWAIKEAVYKAVNHNDPFAPRQVRVRRAWGGEYTCTYRGVDLSGRCRIATWPSGEHVIAMAGVDHSARPAAPGAAVARSMHSYGEDIDDRS
jgi:phosphopantetheinyl transferase